MEAAGVASYEPTTIVKMFNKVSQTCGSRPALFVKRCDKWKSWTWSEYYSDCQRFAKSLMHLMVDRFKIVNIIGFNSPEWLIANNGAILAGCIAAGIYTTNSPSACEYISHHSEAEVVVVEDNAQLEKYLKDDMYIRLPKLKAFVVWGEPVDPANSSCVAGVSVYSFADFLGLGGEVGDEAVTARTADTRPGSCSTLIYTSGTTGPPKAAMLTHDNVTWTIRVLMETYMHGFSSADRVVSYLPLSHIAAQMIDMYMPMFAGV